MTEVFNDFKFKVGDIVGHKLYPCGYKFIVISRAIHELENNVFEKTYHVRNMEIEFAYASELELEARN